MFELAARGTLAKNIQKSTQLLKVPISLLPEQICLDQCSDSDARMISRHDPGYRVYKCIDVIV